jgi:hypothetical protein
VSGEVVAVGHTEPMQRNIDVICDFILQHFYDMDHLSCIESPALFAGNI